MEDGDELAEAYRLQVEAIMEKEAEKRVLEANDPAELDRLRSLSLLELVESEHTDLIPALMSRLGPVRAALDGHGGGLILAKSEIEGKCYGKNCFFRFRSNGVPYGWTSCHCRAQGHCLQ